MNGTSLELAPRGVNFVVLGGVVNSGVDYVALGISETKKMEGASVMACSRWEIFLLVIFLLKE